MEFIGIFFGSRSGFTKPREGLAAGWAVAVIVGLAVLVGAPDEASAFFPPYGPCCSSVPGGSTQWCCTQYDCYYPLDPEKVEQKINRQANGPGCWVLDERCIGNCW